MPEIKYPSDEEISKITAEDPDFVQKTTLDTILRVWWVIEKYERIKSVFEYAKWLQSAHFIVKNYDFPEKPLEKLPPTSRKILETQHFELILSKLLLSDLAKKFPPTKQKIEPEVNFLRQIFAVVQEILQNPPSPPKKSRRRVRRRTSQAISN